MVSALKRHLKPSVLILVVTGDFLHGDRTDEDLTEPRKDMFIRKAGGKVRFSGAS
jgi:hypothetical protein